MAEVLPDTNEGVDPKVADLNEATDSEPHGVRNRRSGRTFAAITVLVLLLIGGVTFFAPSLFTADQVATARQLPDAKNAPEAAALRLLPAPKSQAAPDREGEPTAVPASGRGTELLDSLPQQVGSFALVQIVAEDETTALEHYSGVYANFDDDGDVVVGQGAVQLTVSRWGTEAEATAKAEQNKQSLVAKSSTPAEVPTSARTDSSTAYAIADGDSLTILWSDFTTAGTISGAPEDVQELFSEFSLGAGPAAVFRR